MAGGAPVALVSGTFDLLQPGNLHAIRMAGRLASPVIVMVEPDEVAARHCRKGRPQNPIEARVEMASRLRDVSSVAGITMAQAASVFSGLKPYVWVTAKDRRDGGAYEAALAAGAARIADIESLAGCFSEDVIRAMEEHRTPVALPSGWNDGMDPSRGGAVGPVRVTVNGCFDILHIGHLRFLAEARAMGDSLTVLINSDASVARYKGPTRPVFPEGHRAAALRALEAVDDVVVFQGDNPLEEIRRLRPVIHVKGGSYEPDRVRQERELVESWGGRLVCTPLVGGFSTTDFIRTALNLKHGE